MFNRIFSDHSTAEERKMELAILNLTDDNTPVLGVWYLQEDEGNFVSLVTDNCKFYLVSYETFNQSWTTGLPAQKMTNVKEEKITLDASKNYVCFTFSEGNIHPNIPVAF